MTGLTADEAAEYAREHGATSFAVCPLCELHFPRHEPTALTGGLTIADAVAEALTRAAQQDEATPTRHCTEDHTTLDWVRAASELHVLKRGGQEPVLLALLTQVDTDMQNPRWRDAEAGGRWDPEHVRIWLRHLIDSQWSL